MDVRQSLASVDDVRASTAPRTAYAAAPGSDARWNDLLDCFDALTQSIWAMVAVTARHRPGVAVEMPPVAEAALAAPVPTLPAAPAAEAVSDGSTYFAPSDATVFAEAGDALTLVVKPIERFGVIDEIAGLLRAVEGVGDVRLRRVQRGNAWFSVDYQGTIPPASFIPGALAALQGEVTGGSGRHFEVSIRRGSAGGDKN
jgi:dipeptidyl aminopeptidase/acylaminoacyl peptidase